MPSSSYEAEHAEREKNWLEPEKIDENHLLDCGNYIGHQLKRSVRQINMEEHAVSFRDLV